MSTLSVIVRPSPVVTPTDIAGSHPSNDPAVMAAIAAVTEELDGPTGWLGRAIGPQTLEFVGSDFEDGAIALRCGPIIAVEQIAYLDPALVQRTLEPERYELLRNGSVRMRQAGWPAVGAHPEAVRIRYQAGYDGNPVDEGGTGSVPARVKQAIIVMVQELISIKAENLFVRSEQVEGIGERQFTVTDQAGAIIQRTAERLLSGLRIYA